MPEHILDRGPTTAALLAALKAVFEVGAAPILVGLSAIPQKEIAPGNVQLATAPYVILYPLWANLNGPGFGDDRHADVEWTYQVSLFAARGDQLEGMRDRTIRAVLGKTAGAYTRSLDTAAVKVTERDLKDDTGAGEASGSTLPSDLRFGIHATPADTAP